MQKLFFEEYVEEFDKCLFTLYVVLAMQKL